MQTCVSRFFQKIKSFNFSMDKKEVIISYVKDGQNISIRGAPEDFVLDIVGRVYGNKYSMREFADTIQHHTQNFFPGGIPRHVRKQDDRGGRCASCGRLLKTVCKCSRPDFCVLCYEKYGARVLKEIGSHSEHGNELAEEELYPPVQKAARTE